ncbi:nitroreductase family deazaflavin-dependent oxidoreductase [Nocardioides endophyticus]|uniref:Nitroreductase family deazaflavin-dependent oxidoreductase n=1 Tax=Nocardioides endophyticus TaxID=1353775 RepID=A0ABP8ZGX6_9ACTN
MGFGLPEEKPEGLDSPVTVKVIKYMARAQVRLFKLTNGRVGSKWRIGAGFRKPVPTLLLDHVGRKSGTTFTTPLLYLEDGPNLVIVASQGGLPKDPQWYPNLVAHPDTAVRVRKQGVRRVRARTADADERAELWPRLVELYADFAKYAKWTDREIPIVLLEPR